MLTAIIILMAIPVVLNMVYALVRFVQWWPWRNETSFFWFVMQKKLSSIVEGGDMMLNAEDRMERWWLAR